MSAGIENLSHPRNARKYVESVDSLDFIELDFFKAPSPTLKSRSRVSSLALIGQMLRLDRELASLNPTAFNQFGNPN